MAFEYGVAPRFWSHKAQLQFNEAKRTNGEIFLPGNTIMIGANSGDQLDLDHFLGIK